MYGEDERTTAERRRSSGRRGRVAPATGKRGKIVGGVNPLTERSSRSSVQLDVAPDEQRSFGPAEPDAPFRILILGDFSGRENRGLESKLAGRRPVSVDRDNLDEAIAGMGVAIGLPGVALQFRELDDFHPD